MPFVEQWLTVCIIRKYEWLRHPLWKNRCPLTAMTYHRIWLALAEKARGGVVQMAIRVSNPSASRLLLSSQEESNIFISRPQKITRR